MNFITNIMLLLFVTSAILIHLKMIPYIRINYPYKISVQDIAASANISIAFHREKCDF